MASNVNKEGRASHSPDSVEGVHRENAPPQVPTQQAGQASLDLMQQMVVFVQSLARAAQPRSILERLAKHRPVDFCGRKDDNPSAAEVWLERVERIFNQMHCTPEQRLECAVSLLQEDAYLWWMSISSLHTPQEQTWDFFRTEFQEKYVGRIYLDSMRRDFLYLKQRQLSVTEYEREFTRLSRYYPELVATEPNRCRRFEDGLNYYIRLRVTGLLIDDFSRLLTAAINIERVRGEEQARKNRENQKRGVGMSKADSNSFKKPKFGETSSVGRTFVAKQGQGSGSRTRYPITSVASAPGSMARGPTQPSYEHCGRLHKGESRLLTGACFKCGSLDHFLRNCPQIGNPLQQLIDKATPSGNQSRRPESGPTQGNKMGATSNVANRPQTRAPARAYVMRTREEQDAPDVIVGHYSSYGSSSSSFSHQTYQQPSYAQPSHSYAPPHPTYGGQPSETKRKLERKYSRIDDNFNNLDQVTDALARAGLESSNLIVGIDFTKSNEWTGARSFHRRSLHHIGDEQNPYEQAISIVGRTLSKFDEDNLIPCFGFGDASTHDQEVFSFFPDERFCDGFEEVLRQYRELVPQLQLAGPTSFAPIIEMAVTIVEQSGGQYHVLLIIADGQVTRSVDTGCGQLSPQEKKTVEAIVKASEYPLSIILVGVGDGPWDMMREFGDNIPDRAFDNFQFVNFTEIMSKSMDPYRKEAEFALAALMEIPSHYKATLELNILGASRGKDVDRVPLPPPLYGATSFTPPKPSHSSSFNPSAPSSGGHDPAAFTSQPTNHASDNHLCPICITEPKDMAFGCGHQTCCECAQDLSSCPICRQPIETRIKLY